LEKKSRSVMKAMNPVGREIDGLNSPQLTRLDWV